MFEDTDDKFYVFNSLYTEVVDEFYPVKTKETTKKYPAYVNKVYRKNIYKKSQSDNKRKRFPGKVNHEAFRVQRNFCAKLRNSALRDYFVRKCSGGAKGGRDFWDAVGPFFNGKSTNKQSAHIDLIENNEIVSNQTQVCNILNTHFITKPANIGNSSTLRLDGPLENTNLTAHPSVQTILQSANKCDFNFDYVTQEQVRSSIKGLKNKAPGHDKITAKILKISSPQIVSPLSSVFNSCEDTSTFPSACKKAEVTPGHKKGADTDKTNFRPLSVLPSVGKVFEDLMLEQLELVNNTVLHTLISAYRPGYGCQEVLLHMLDSITQALDQNKMAGAVTTDLSSAFDCMPPNLMYHKLVAYGFTHQAALLIHSYLTNRSQRVKIGSAVGEWLPLAKGTPQGSKLGPALWNLFINDLLYSLPQDSAVNFADDNTLYAVEETPRGLETKLNSIVNQAQQWYIENGMQPNPTKFQSIFFGETPQCTVNVDNINIQPTGVIKLLGVSIDSQLSFSQHINEICRKAGCNLNVLKRVAHSLPQKVKLLLYNTYISCHFNFCPLVWHFCSGADTEKLERLQYRALRFVFADYESDYDSLLLRANMPKLELSRQRQICVQVFKCVHKLAPQYLSNMYTFQDKSLHNTRSALALAQSHYKSVRHGQKSFKCYSTHLWNNLPSNIRAVADLESFKSMINTWMGTQCKCNFCKWVQ